VVQEEEIQRKKGHVQTKSRPKLYTTLHLL